MMECLWQTCDATTWVVAFMLLSSILGFGLTVGLTKSDDVMARFDVKSSVAFARAAEPMIRSPAP